MKNVWWLILNDRLRSEGLIILLWVYHSPLGYAVSSALHPSDVGCIFTTSKLLSRYISCCVWHFGLYIPSKPCRQEKNSSTRTSPSCDSFFFFNFSLCFQPFFIELRGTVLYAAGEGRYSQMRTSIEKKMLYVLTSDTTTYLPAIAGKPLDRKSYGGHLQRDTHEALSLCGSLDPTRTIKRCHRLFFCFY